MTGKRVFSKRLLLLGAIATSPIGVIPLFQYLALSPFGSEDQVYDLFFGLVLFCAFLTLLIAPLLLLFRPARRLALQSPIVAGILIVSILLGFFLCEPVRKVAFQRLAEHSTPLVQAIRSYESRHAMPPSSLADLVPEFLPAIPTTGMAAYPHYEYYVGEEASRRYNNPWALKVWTRRGSIGSTSFMYFPRQNYPLAFNGDLIERVADWAHLYE